MAPPRPFANYILLFLILFLFLLYPYVSLPIFTMSVSCWGDFDTKTLHNHAKPHHGFKKPHHGCQEVFHKHCLHDEIRESTKYWRLDATGGMKVQIRTQLPTSRKDRHLIDTSKGLYPTGPALGMAWVPRGTKAKL